MTTTPQTLIPPRDLPLKAYKLIRFTQFCSNCNTNHEHSELYGLYPLRSGFGLARIMKPSDVQYNLPVVVEKKAQPDITPFCHDCWQPGMLNHLPPPPAPPPTNVPSDLGKMAVINKPTPRTRYYDAQGRERFEDQDAQASAAPKQKRTPKFTVDDL